MSRTPRLRRLVTVGGALLVVNSVYLGTHASATPFYFANVVLHLVLGIATGIAAIRWVRRSQAALTPAGCVAATLLGIAAVFGLALMVTGATRPFYWLLYAHIVVASAGVVVTIALAAAAAVRSMRGRPRTAAVAWTLLAVGVVGWTTAVMARQQAAEREAYRIVNPEMAPARMEGEGAGPHGAFFPSSAETNVGGIPEGILYRYRKVNPRIPYEVHASPHDLPGYDEPLFPVADTEIGRIGCAICYDWLFPEAIRQLDANGAEVLVRVSAYMDPWGATEPMNWWTIVNRCRALENLA